jgi:chromosome segregation ATPase
MFYSQPKPSRFKEVDGMAEFNDIGEIEERLADAQTQIESLQTTAADAEARAATAQQEAAALREQAEASESALEAAQTRLKESAARYRTARLAAMPEIPPELVTECDTVEEVEREFEAVLRVAEVTRERLLAQQAAERRAMRVPGGAPVRREQDIDSLPAIEKIKIGLQRLSEREGR